MNEDIKYRMHYVEKDRDGDKVERPGEYYEEVAGAVEERVSYYKCAKEMEPDLKLQLKLETDNGQLK